MQGVGVTTGIIWGKTAGVAVPALKSPGGPLLKQASLFTFKCLVHRVNGTFVLSFSIHLHLVQETYKPKQTMLTSIQSNLANTASPTHLSSR